MRIKWTKADVNRKQLEALASSPTFSISDQTDVMAERQAVMEASHTMPDGTVMPDAEIMPNGNVPA